MTRILDWGRRLGTNISSGVRRGIATRALPRNESVWVVVRIHAAMGEGPPPIVAREPMLGLLEALEVLESAADDPRVAGVLLRIVGAPSGWSRVHSLRRAVSRVREAGKPVAAYAETLDAAGFLLATAATKVWLPEAGSLFLVGLRAESYFFRGLLEHLGVRPEVVRAGDYKSAAERFTRDRMSPEGREQVEALVDDLFSELVDGIATGRGLDADHVKALIDRGPFPARTAAELRLIDACIYPDEVEDQLALLCGEPDDRADDETEPSASPSAAQRPKVRLFDAIVYRNLRLSARAFIPMRTSLARIAYVVASGTIGRGTEGRGIVSGSMSKMFESLRERDDIRGVVLRIDSPGGDAIASDLLWRAASRVAEVKPVVASMGDVAASGGYFLAAAAHRVFAEAGTVTGSIGVIGGKLNLEGLYERLGVSTDAVERGARAGLLAGDRNFTPDERAAVRQEISGMYEIFIDRVAIGRGLSREAVDRVARGRVWSGAAARSHGLVDEIGGPLDALRSVCTSAGLDSDDPIALDRFPRRGVLARVSPALLWPGRGGALDGIDG
jgi:protease-4